MLNNKPLLMISLQRWKVCDDNDLYWLTYAWNLNKRNILCGIFITELHDEINVVTFRFIAALISFQWCFSFTIKQRRVQLIETAAMLIKVMCKQWHLRDHCIPAQLTCRPQLLYTYPILEDFSYGQWMWEAWRNEKASIVQVIMQCMITWALLPPL